jgi:hypothetical protein
VDPHCPVVAQAPPDRRVGNPSHRVHNDRELGESAENGASISVRGEPLNLGQRK